MSHLTCEHCKFWTPHESFIVGEDADTGTCQRLPPQPAVVWYELGYMPATYKWQWCGEFTPQGKYIGHDVFQRRLHKWLYPAEASDEFHLAIAAKNGQQRPSD